MKRRKGKKPSPPVAILIDRRTWREFTEAIAAAAEASAAARDTALQLRELLALKTRQQLAAKKAVETRRAHEAAADDDGVDLTAPFPGSAPEANGPAPRPEANA